MLSWLIHTPCTSSHCVFQTCRKGAEAMMRGLGRDSIAHLLGLSQKANGSGLAGNRGGLRGGTIPLTTPNSEFLIIEELLEPTCGDLFLTNGYVAIWT